MHYFYNYVYYLKKSFIKSFNKEKQKNYNKRKRIFDSFIKSMEHKNIMKAFKAQKHQNNLLEENQVYTC